VDRVVELQALAQMHIAKADERLARADERFAKIEQENHERWARLDEERRRVERELRNEIAETKAVLQTLVKIVTGLPDAVREKIGFAVPRQAPPPSTATP
jgi:flagellar motility protein MotE (MotC chaperone)